MTNALTPDPLKAHRLVDTTAGIAPPPRQWSELRRRWEAFSELGTACRDALVAAVVDGAGDVPVPTLAALATAEAGEAGAGLGQRATVTNSAAPTPSCCR